MNVFIVSGDKFLMQSFALDVLKMQVRDCSNNWQNELPFL